MASGRSVSAALFDLRTVTINVFIIYVPYRTPSGRGFEDGFRAVETDRPIRSPNCYNNHIDNIRPVMA